MVRPEIGAGVFLVLSARSTTRFVALSLLLLVGCAEDPGSCESTCAGCCREGLCLPGDQSLACGGAGRTCDTCLAGQTCSRQQVCVMDSGSSADAGSPSDGGSSTDAGSPSDGGSGNARWTLDGGPRVGLTCRGNEDCQARVEVCASTGKCTTQCAQPCAAGTECGLAHEYREFPLPEFQCMPDRLVCGAAICDFGQICDNGSCRCTPTAPGRIDSCARVGRVCGDDGACRFPRLQEACTPGSTTGFCFPGPYISIVQGYGEPAQHCANVDNRPVCLWNCPGTSCGNGSFCAGVDGRGTCLPQAFRYTDACVQRPVTDGGAPVPVLPGERCLLRAGDGSFTEPGRGAGNCTVAVFATVDGKKSYASCVLGLRFEGDACETPFGPQFAPTCGTGLECVRAPGGAAATCVRACSMRAPSCLAGEVCTPVYPDVTDNGKNLGVCR